MISTTRARLVTTFVLFAGSATIIAAQTPQENAADAERLTRALALTSGQTVCEIGAGGGELTVALARVVGDTGRVLSNEINKQSLAKIGKAVEAAGLHNVTLVEGREQETNFPSSSCDALFMRDVYHHFVNPPTMNASILQSLKPGGRLAIIDFTPPPGGENPAGSRAIDNHHGITPPTLERELKAAGFEAVTASEPSPRNFLVVGRHPS